MTHRALSLLSLSRPSLILDVGCGSGLSGTILSSDADGGPHTWVGMDISASMLDIALQREVEGDLLLADIGQGVPFRAGTFDAAISISAIQWLCNAESSEVSAAARLARFFNTLYASLKRGGRAVCQFYPKNGAQRTMISSAAVRAGFGAGILEDDPDSKNTKLYLVLTVGGGNLGRDGDRGGDITVVVRHLDDVEVLDGRKGKSARSGKGSGKAAQSDSKAAAVTAASQRKGSKAWIVAKKEQMSRQGKVVKANSKYTGRKRKITF